MARIFARSESAFYLGSLQNKVCAEPHSSVEALKKKLLEEWEKLADEYLRVTVVAYPRRLQVVIILMDAESNKC
uniref:Uncharacterized protein n=1 Tax=Caenorhabditis japonica TaxID=281687 RepID=A0A8R1ELW2_CAEJA